MNDLSQDLQKPARKASRAARATQGVAEETAAAVAAEAKTFSRNSGRALKTGAAKAAQNAKVVQSAAAESADIAQARLRTALASLQQTSEEMSRWAGTRAVEARDQATHLVQERPLGVVASIFAVGALLGVVAGMALRD
jgi:ElaB/YqjD/DUF883 family membrane-anchored ribosome-binding protein